jgi:phosphoribosylglycinamide formyltransferase 2
MVTLGNTQNYSEFELHARAILGIPVEEITLEKNGASAVVLAERESANFPIFSGINQAAAYSNSDFKLFGKPSTRPYRRMAVALAFGDEPVEKLVEKAKEIASHIKVN